jgi:hypothetical protein
VVEPGIYRYPKMDGIVFGRPWTEVLAEVVAPLGARRIFVLASATLAARAGLDDTLATRLGGSLAAVHVGIRAHTPRDDVVAAAAAARAANADLIVTIGGSSVTDAGKMLQLCLAANIRVAAALDPWRAALRPLIPALAVRMVSIPTTLSGAEFTALAGCTDLQRRVKEAFAHPEMIPHTVILDPQITLHAPMPLWLSSGLRAVDHAVETLCAVHPQPLFEAAASRALALLVRGLPLTKRDPSDLSARLEASLASGYRSSARRPALPWVQATASDMRWVAPPAFLMGSRPASCSRTCCAGTRWSMPSVSAALRRPLASPTRTPGILLPISFGGSNCLRGCRRPGLIARHCRALPRSVCMTATSPPIRDGSKGIRIS